MKHPNMEKVYAVYASFYDRVFKSWLFPRQKYALRRMDIKPGDSVLEIGVGTGLALPEYPRHCKVTGIDISEHMLDKAREKVDKQALQHVALCRMDAMNLEFEDGKFDHVVMAFVVSVLSDPVKAVKEAKRVSRKNGTIIIVNHFRSKNPLIAGIENVVSPICYRLGWRTDLHLEQIMEEAELKVEKVHKMRRADPYSIVFAANC